MDNGGAHEGVFPLTGNLLGGQAARRLHPNVLVAALANKLVRIAWTVLAQERSDEARVTKAAA
jgi:hypothetical protein